MLSMVRGSRNSGEGESSSAAVLGWKMFKGFKLGANKERDKAGAEVFEIDCLTALAAITSSSLSLALSIAVLASLCAWLAKVRFGAGPSACSDDCARFLDGECDVSMDRLDLATRVVSGASPRVLSWSTSSLSESDIY